jgi:alpha-galactosidase
MFLEPKLKGSELHLVDVDKDALDLTKRYLDRANDAVSAGWMIHASELDVALADADVVIVSISTGGLESMHNDYHIPAKYGVFHTVGDTVGPAGVSRVLRNVPVFIDIARRMEKLCPEAWMVHVTNPLSQLTRAVAKATSIKCVGLCHEYIGTIKMLQNFFSLDSRDDIDSLCMGVNHFTFLMDLKVRGLSDPESRMTLTEYMKYEMENDGTFKTGTTDDEVRELLAEEDRKFPYHFNFHLHETLGYFPLAAPSHIAENLPFYCNSEEKEKEYHLHRKGVLPERADRKKVKTERIIEVLEKNLPQDEIKERSNEMLCDAVVGLCAGEPRRLIGAMPNIGQIDNLSRDVVVETWTTASLAGINPVASGSIPLSLKGVMEQIIVEQELGVEAALTGDVKIFTQAIFNSPQLHQKDKAAELADELLAANKKFLPQFK